METKTTITKIEQEDLVNLLCTATYGSDWLSITAPERTGVTIEDGDCREDIWAKCLLAHHVIKCQDFNAEGETYGNLGRVIKKDESAVYFVGLGDIVRGLERCADGAFKSDDGSEKGWLRECWCALIDQSEDFDYPMASALMQIIMFNELVY